MLLFPTFLQNPCYGIGGRVVTGGLQYWHGRSSPSPSIFLHDVDSDYRFFNRCKRKSRLIKWGLQPETFLGINIKWSILLTNTYDIYNIQPILMLTDLRDRMRLHNWHHSSSHTHSKYMANIHRRERSPSAVYKQRSSGRVSHSEMGIFANLTRVVLMGAMFFLFRVGLSWMGEYLIRWHAFNPFSDLRHPWVRLDGRRTRVRTRPNRFIMTNQNQYSNKLCARLNRLY